MKQRALVGVCRPGSHAERYLKSRESKNNPAVPDLLRSNRLVLAAFHGLIARLRAEGWSDELIKDRRDRINKIDRP